ncbi:MAG: protein kinase [Planctomycetes bacterium]|nr:protein kinase [Planctomycetota bacterium]
MDDSWERLKAVAGDALEQPPAEREAFLRAVCGEDAALLAEACALLAADAEAGDFLRAEAELPSSVRRLERGATVGPYVIEALLGEGGSSEVYRARQAAPIQREVALKLLKPGMDSRALLTRFAAERQTLARLDHPHVTRVLDAGALESGRPWVVVELVQGLPLTSFVARERLTLQARLELFLQVCDAVAHAHRRGVVHRDLKPANVLVARSDGAPWAKVIDFGIAKLLEPSDAGAPLTTTGILLGTPAYASPEQLDEQGDIDTRTDVWSLGVILYELLTDTRPSDGSDGQEPSIAELVRRVRNDAIEPPSRRARRRTREVLRLELDWIVAHALERDRERRYPTVDALAFDVRRFLAREPLSVGPPTLRYRIATAARRHRALLGAAVLALFALLAGSVASFVGLLSARTARDEANLAARAEREQRTLAEELAESHRRARADAEAALAEASAVGEFLSDLLLAAEPSKAGREVRVVDVLGVIEPRFASVAAFPVVAARLRRIVAQCYLGLGDYAAAEPHLELALELGRQHFAADDWRYVDMLSILADLRARQGRFAELEPILEELDSRARASKGPEHPLARFILDLRAKIAFDRGRPAEAAVALRALLALDEAAGRTKAVLLTHGNLSQILLTLGQSEEARMHAERALSMARETYGEDHPLAIAAARKLAAVHLHRGEIDALIAALEPLVEKARAVLGPKHPDTLGIENYLARGYQKTQRLEEAEALYRRVIAAQAEALSKEHPQAVMAIQSFGQVLEARGDLAGAEDALRDANQRFRSLRGTDHADTWYALALLSRVMTSRGRCLEAAEPFASAIDGLQRTLGQGNARTIEARSAWVTHLLRLGAVQREKGALADARAAWERAFELGGELGQEVARREAAGALAALAEAEGDAASAQRWRELAR